MDLHFRPPNFVGLLNLPLPSAPLRPFIYLVRHTGFRPSDVTERAVRTRDKAATLCDGTVFWKPNRHFSRVSYTASRIKTVVGNRSWSWIEVHQPQAITFTGSEVTFLPGSPSDLLLSNIDPVRIYSYKISRSILDKCLPGIPSSRRQYWYLWTPSAHTIRSSFQGRANYSGISARTISSERCSSTGLLLYRFSQRGDRRDRRDCPFRVSRVKDWFS